MNSKISNALDRMFDNPGHKLKVLAKWLFFLTVIAAVVIAIEVGIQVEEIVDRWGDKIKNEYSFDIPLMIEVILAGIGVAYFDSLLLTAFGELVMNSGKGPEKTETENTTATTFDPTAAPFKAAPASSTNKLTAKVFVDAALSYKLASGTFEYAKSNFASLDKEGAGKLAELKNYIDNNDEEGLKAALLAIRDNLG